MQPQQISFSTILQELTALSIRQAQPEPQLEVAHPQLGCIRMQRHVMPGIHLSSLQWTVGSQPLQFADETHSDDININLQLKGSLFSQFSCLPTALHMQPGRHNLLVTSEPGGHHTVQAGDVLDVFHLSLKPEKLSQYLDPSEAQGELLLQKIQKEKPLQPVPFP
ncbi:hypothetical protein [Cesiribacter andamanensis]|uniref:Uncharacterized protein n=1 Tax=Cesiribacter andamanensis AMV16 TaxID=1279009 RepID=M7NTY9_9BACT|nr:hypothetical protein [Cesiribacter andamanensis]EMR01949.1 hypothetical protein ADICEAN_02928 [Cesiribacter andamanensis AMV16]